MLQRPYPPCSPPVMMTIAGSDCSAGAGLQTDLKTAHALGVYGLTVVTCVVSEVPGIVRGIQEMPANFVVDQTALCLEHFPVGAIKTGMLYSPAIVEALSGVLRDRGIPLVVDPVMIATAGNPLMQKEAVVVYEDKLIPLATLLTPNLDEAAALLEAPPITAADELADAARALTRRYGINILLKGGHLENECRDVLMTKEGSLFEWNHPKVKGAEFHGTGCTLSAAIASCLAKGLPLKDSVEQGLDFIAAAIAGHYRWESPGRVDALSV